MIYFSLFCGIVKNAITSTIKAVIITLMVVAVVTFSVSILPIKAMVIRYSTTLINILPISRRRSSFFTIYTIPHINKKEMVKTHKRLDKGLKVR